MRSLPMLIANMVASSCSVGTRPSCLAMFAAGAAIVASLPRLGRLRYCQGARGRIMWRRGGSGRLASVQRLDGPDQQLNLAPVAPLCHQDEPEPIEARGLMVADTRMDLAPGDVLAERCHAWAAPDDRPSGRQRFD